MSYVIACHDNMKEGAIRPKNRFFEPTIVDARQAAYLQNASQRWHEPHWFVVHAEDSRLKGAYGA